jgi:hypothetical protein
VLGGYLISLVIPGSVAVFADQRSAVQFCGENRNKRTAGPNPPPLLKEPELSMKEQTVRNRRLFENVKVLKIHGLP